jgi:hypothetical protein
LADFASVCGVDDLLVDTDCVHVDFVVVGKLERTKRTLLLGARATSKRK